MLPAFRQLLLQFNVTPESIAALERSGLTEPRKLKVFSTDQLMAHMPVTLPQAMAIISAAKVSPP